MADEPTTPVAEPQAGEPTTPQPQAGATTPTEPQAGDSHNSEQISLDEARKLRSEANNLRKRLKAFEDAEQAAKDAQLSEVERVKKLHADLQAQYEALVKENNEIKINSLVLHEASKQQFKRPEIASKLVDRAAIEYDDTGTPKNIDKLLEKLLKHMPELGPDLTPVSQTATIQAAAPNAQGAPAIPAMNMSGRSSIPAPDSQPAFPKGTRPSLSAAHEMIDRSRRTT